MDSALLEREPPILEMRGISKSFGRTKALSNVALSVRAGEIHALMGENGAGKSTLMRVLSGAFGADPGGEIRIAGKPVEISGPMAGRDLGISVIYQELSLATTLTVAENIYLGRELGRYGLARRREMLEGCRGILDRLGAGFGPSAIVSGLSIAERQLVEIARAIHFNARILIMDEPTTALSLRETERLFELIRRFRSEGMAIIYISHRMAEIYELADRCSVLRDGEYIGLLEKHELSADRLVRMMVGRDISNFYKKADGGKAVSASPVIEVEGISDGGRVRNCSFEVRGGEVLGIAGLVGSGRTELAHLLFGARRRSSGAIRVNGRPVPVRSPADAIAAGIVYLTEDRKGNGVLLDLTVEENINLSVASRDARFGWLLNRRRRRERADSAIRSLSIKVSDRRRPVRTLSGGNQQKVLLSRLLETNPRILILDEPTRGVDIGAKSEIYRLIDALAASGAAIIIISSELPEIIGIADRVLVMREGEIVGEAGGQGGVAITQENLMALSTGVAPADDPQGHQKKGTEA